MEILALWLIEDCFVCHYNLITLPEEIMARLLNFKMVTMRFFNFSEEVINAIVENSIPKSKKDGT